MRDKKAAFTLNIITLTKFAINRISNGTELRHAKLFVQNFLNFPLPTCSQQPPEVKAVSSLL